MGDRLEFVGTSTTVARPSARPLSDRGFAAADGIHLVTLWRVVDYPDDMRHLECCVARFTPLCYRVGSGFVTLGLGPRALIRRDAIAELGIAESELEALRLYCHRLNLEALAARALAISLEKRVLWARALEGKMLSTST